jgi:copper(I)-binding protein
MRTLATLSTLLLLLALGCRRGVDLPMTRAGELTFSQVMIPEPIITRNSPDSASMAAYLTIANEGDLADTVVSVESPLARTGTLHGAMEHGGMMAMTALVLPPHSVTRMAPGGNHFMFEGLSRAFVAGDQVPLVLKLARAGAVSVNALVVSYDQFDALRGDSPSP